MIFTSTHHTRMQPIWPSKNMVDSDCTQCCSTIPPKLKLESNVVFVSYYKSFKQTDWGQKLKHREYQVYTGSMVEPKKEVTSIYADTVSIMELKKRVN